MYKLAVLLSGRGSNFEAILKAIESGFITNGRIVVVVSDNRQARGLEIARKHNIEAVFFDPEAKSREEYDRVIVDYLKQKDVDFVLLAGYMRILSEFFVKSFKNQILNIHPALLPSFKGLRAQKQALKKGVKIAGATVHFVTEDLDDGPIIIQSAVPVFDDDDEELLSERILKTEHKIYPYAVKLLVEDRLTLKNGRVYIKDAEKEIFFVSNPAIGGSDGV